MLTESQKFKLGVFVIAAIILLIAAVLVFAGGQLTQRRYHAYTIFTESVQGLEVGSAVKLRGVPVGQVSRIEICTPGAAPAGAPSGKEEMKILVRLEISGSNDAAPRLNEAQWKRFITQQVARGARCQLAFAGITGMKFIQIDYYAKPGDSPPKPPDTLGVDVSGSIFIPAQPSLLAGMTVDLTETLAKLANVPFDKIGKDTNELVVAVKRLANGLDALVRDQRVDNVLSSLAETSQNLAKLTGRADTELKAMRERVEQGVNQFTSAVSEIEKLVKDVRGQLKGGELGETLKAARDGLLAAEEALKAFGRLRSDLQPTLDRLDDAVHSLDRLSKTLEADPSALLRGKRKPKSKLWSR